MYVNIEIDSNLVGEFSTNKGTDLDVLNGGGRGRGDEDNHTHR